MSNEKYIIILSHHARLSVYLYSTHQINLNFGRMVF